MKMTELQSASSLLLLDWANRLSPYYGKSGSMDLDLLLFPNAEGPSMYNQFAHYAMLLLSEGIVPGASRKDIDKLRNLALKNITYVLNTTNKDFKRPHFSRGKDWGPINSEWILYFLLRSCEIIVKTKLGSVHFRNRLAAMIQGAIAGGSCRLCWTAVVRHWAEGTGRNRSVGMELFL